MNLPQILWAIGTILFTVGLSLIRLKAFNGAKICFWIMPFFILTATSVWIMRTDNPLWQRIIFSGLIGAVVFISVTESLRLVKHHHQRDKQSNEPLQGARGGRGGNANATGKHAIAIGGRGGNGGPPGAGVGGDGGSGTVTGDYGMAIGGEGVKQGKQIGEDVVAEVLLVLYCQMLYFRWSTIKRFWAWRRWSPT